jgi:hypothetical protein
VGDEARQMEVASGKCSLPRLPNTGNVSVLGAHLTAGGPALFDPPQWLMNQTDIAVRLSACVLSGGQEYNSLILLDASVGMRRSSANDTVAFFYAS